MLRSSVKGRQFLNEGLIGLGVLLGALSLIPAKRAITGNSGPMTVFLAVVVVSPLTLLLIRLLRGGSKAFAFQLLLVLIATLITWMTYPDQPATNFTREVPGLCLPWLSLAAFLGGYRSKEV